MTFMLMLTSGKKQSGKKDLGENVAQESLLENSQSTPVLQSQRGSVETVSGHRDLSFNSEAVQSFIFGLKHEIACCRHALWL